MEDLLPSGEICEEEVRSRAGRGRKDRETAKMLCCTMRPLTMSPQETPTQTGSSILEWHVPRQRQIQGG